MMHYHYTKNTNNGAERLSHYPAYTKMMAPQAHVIQNHVADHSCNDHVAAASRDDEETVATAANTLAEWRGNKVPEKEAKALRHVFDDLQDHFGYQRVDPRVRFNSPTLARLGNSGSGLAIWTLPTMSTASTVTLPTSASTSVLISHTQARPQAWSADVERLRQVMGVCLRQTTDTR